MIMNAPLPIPLGPQIGTTGRYRYAVTEPACLQGLRRLAGLMSADDALFPRDYDGSIDQYYALTPRARALHDGFLSGLVSRYKDRLEEDRSYYKVGPYTEEANNLILDQGLNNIMTSYSWATAFACCAVGTGTTPTVTSSGVITATASGSTVTSSASFFTAPMTGMLLHFNSGEERYITFIDATHATLSSALTIGTATLFAVWDVAQTGLSSETKRSNLYLTGAGNCGTSFTSTSIAFQRTFDFSVEVANQNYTELGWSNTMTAGNNLFSRALIAAGTVTVLIGQALRVVYTITVNLSNATTVGTYPSTGWPVAPSTLVSGSYSLGNPLGNTDGPPFGTVNTSGGSSVTSGAAYEISGEGGAPQGPWLQLGTGTALPAFGNEYASGTVSAANSATTGSYTAGTFQRDYNFHWLTSSGNRSDFRGIEFRVATTAFIFVFDQNQTKDNTHTLDVSIIIKIGRVLTNP